MPEPTTAACSHDRAGVACPYREHDVLCPQIDYHERPATAAQRLGRLVDRRLYNTDAQYHAEIRRFQHLLDITRLAMEDEVVDPRVIDRVLNRIVYGVPDGADAYERIERHDEEIKRMMMKPGPGVIL